MKNIVVLMLVILSSCNNREATGPQVPEKSKTLNTYLALGDSYTIGESVAPEMRWPEQLVDSLRQRGIDIADPKIIAKTGWTTDDLLEAMQQELDPSETYDLVSVLIGVNNQYQGKSIEDYREDLKKIFSRAIAHSKSGSEGVFAVSIPDYGATPFGASDSERISEEISAFNKVYKEVAASFDIRFFNITPISERAATDPDLTAEDDLHPSGEMYSLWVGEFAEEVFTNLSIE